MLWPSLSPLLSRDSEVAGSTDHTADSFAEFFDKKVRDGTGIENGVVIPGVVQTVHTDRGASHHYAVAG